jgi:hypothetical protein
LVTESVALPPDLWSADVPEYRAYLIGTDGHFVDAIPFVCVDDAEAAGKAERLVDGHDVELWQLDRKVATFTHVPKVD